MGNCGGICNSNHIKSKVDIILPSQEQEILKYYDNNDLKKIVYIQKYIRKYLSKLKSKKRLNLLKISSINNSSKKTQSQSEKDLQKIIKDSPHKVNNHKNSKKFKKNNKYITYDEEPTSNELLIPTICTPLMDNNLFVDDPFLKNGKIKSNNDNNSTDPRDEPNDGIRRKFPKIKEDQSSYEGEWKNGKRDGYGILCFGNQSKFMGLFKEDKLAGYGKLWYDGEDYYRGYWKEFKAEGIGIYKTKKGSYFTGEWKNDRQNGFGMENWPKGSNFLGEYSDGYKNGIGILSFGSKAGYKGEFKEGVITGIGTFYFEDLRKYEGQWKNNKMHGYGIIFWPEGDVFEGEFYEDKKCGFGIFYNKNKIYMGNWKNNKPEGDMIIIDGDKIKRQFWENGRPIRFLEQGYKTSFEKYIDIILKEYKKNKNKMIIDN